MLSRILCSDAVQTTRVVWRSRFAEAREAPQTTASANTSSGEVAQLKKRIAEMTAAMEQQTRDAYQAGFRAGEASGREAAAGEVKVVVERLAQTIDEVAGTRADVLRRAESDVVHLSITIARRILHRELSLDNGALEALIKAAVEKLQGQELHRVRVHPEQQQLIRNCLEEMGRGQNIEIVSDPTQAKGGAIFEIARGSLDASVDTQLREIERGLVDQLAERL